MSTKLITNCVHIYVVIIRKFWICLNIICTFITVKTLILMIKVFFFFFFFFMNTYEIINPHVLMFYSEMINNFIMYN